MTRPGLVFSQGRLSAARGHCTETDMRASNARPYGTVEASVSSSQGRLSAARGHCAETDMRASNARPYRTVEASVSSSQGRLSAVHGHCTEADMRASGARPYRTVEASVSSSQGRLSAARLFVRIPYPRSAPLSRSSPCRGSGGTASRTARGRRRPFPAAPHACRTRRSRRP